MEGKIDYPILDALFQFLNTCPVMPLLKYKLMDDLALLEAILIDHPEVYVEYDLFKFESAVTSTFSSYDVNNMNELMALNFCTEISEISVSMREWADGQSIYEERENLYCPSQYGEFEENPSYYPSTGQAVFIYHLLENLEELLTETATTNRPLNYVISRLHRQLHFLVPHFLEITIDSPSDLKSIVTDITNLAYEVEYAVDSFLVGDIPSSHCIFWLLKILKSFRTLWTERRDGEDDVVEFEAKKTLIHDMLYGGDGQLNLLSISGMSNIGKTKFAEELFASPSCVDHFDYGMMGYVRDPYKREELLLELISHIVDLTDECLSMSGEELTMHMQKFLEGEKYIVVIMNVNKLVVWNDLRRCFPESHKGSKILITSSGWKFAFQAKSQIKVQPIGERTWEILREAVFQKETCPPELFKVGMKIANRCKRFSFRSVVSLLKKYEKRVMWWEEIANTLGSYMIGNLASQEMRILELSCTNLADYLKPCLLYLQVFFHEKIILVSKLIKLWIAEGFVINTAPQTLEKTGETYVAELMALNLLLPFEEKSIGGPKICFVNELLGAYTLPEIVVRDNFLYIVDGRFLHKKSAGLFHPNMSPSSTITYQRCLCGSEDMKEFIKRKNSAPFLQSLFFSAYPLSDGNHVTPDLSYSESISFIFDKYKFLKILKLEDTIIGESFTKVGVLVLLRYLEVQSILDYIPSSVANLWNLQTFHFKGSTSEVVKVPDSIWDMENLRHLHINKSASFDIEPHRLEKCSSVLDNLQTFSTPSLAYGSDMEKMLRKIAGIQKLKCIYQDSWDDARNCNQFPVLEFLNQLISLNVIYKGGGKYLYPCQFNFPSNLKKLTLSKFGMSWDEITQVAMLSNLEVLKLINNAFEGEIWGLGDHLVFPKLKFFKLEKIDIVEWRANRNNFPVLERLLVHKCENLVEIPQDFAYINTLRRIEVLESNPSAQNSTISILEEHIVLYGKYKLYIHLDRAEMIEGRWRWTWEWLTSTNEGEYP